MPPTLHTCTKPYQPQQLASIHRGGQWGDSHVHRPTGLPLAGEPTNCSLQLLRTLTDNLNLGPNPSASFSLAPQTRNFAPRSRRGFMLL